MTSHSSSTSASSLLSAFPSTTTPPTAPTPQASSTNQTDGINGVKSLQIGEELLPTIHAFQTSKIRIGILALRKKTKSKIMQNFLSRLNRESTFEIVEFPESLILNNNISVKEWPPCEVLLCFHSSGFPIKKALQYEKHHKNAIKLSLQDVTVQKQVLLNRESVYLKLREYQIPITSNYPFCIIKRRQKKRPAKGYHMEQVQNKILVTMPIRNMGNKTPSAVAAAAASTSSSSSSSSLDTIITSSATTTATTAEEQPSSLSSLTTTSAAQASSITVVMEKPFIEKPLDSNNHYICIYYPNGSCRTLHRKIENRCSSFNPDQKAVRQNDSFIYEPFFPILNGVDIKVYLISNYNVYCTLPKSQRSKFPLSLYIYAEQRNSPTTTTTVERTATGLEKRHVVQLTPQEVEMAKGIVKAFKQSICGFDILRINESDSRVCDVNGFSFVKGNESFYEVSAVVFKKMIWHLVQRTREEQQSSSEQTTSSTSDNKSEADEDVFEVVQFK